MRWRFTLTKTEIVLGVPVDTVLVISEPIGWKDLQFTLKRDKVWHGVFFEYSLPLKFYNSSVDTSKNAYTFLHEHYDEVGVEGFVLMLVELACDGTDEFTEEGLWKLNFTSYTEERKFNYHLVELNMEPDNCLMIFKNRYDQKVDLDTETSFDQEELDPYTGLGFTQELLPKMVPETANLKSLNSGSNDSFENVLQEDTVSAGTGTVTHDVIGYFWYGMSPSLGLDEIEVRNEFGNGSSNLFTDMLPIYVVKYGGEYTITVTVQGTTMVTIQTNGNNTACSGDQDTFNYMKHEVWLEAGATTVLLYTADSTGCFSPNLFFPSIPVAGDVNVFNLNAGDEIKLYVRVEASGEWNRDLVDAHPLNWDVHFNGYALMDVYAKTLSEPSNTRAYLINESGSRILEAITNDCFRFLSNYYGRTDSEPYVAPALTDGCGSLRFFTKGLQIRNYINTLDEPTNLNMSFKDFFEGLNAIDNIGIGLEEDAARPGNQVIRAEPMKYFYTDDQLLFLDKVPSIKITVIQDEHYSVYKNGYQKWENEDYMGIDEFNSRREYRTALTQITNTIEKVCSFIASGYTIEIGRRKKFYSTTTQEDWRYDNDTFIICVDRNIGFGYIVEQGNVLSASNLFDPDTVYNYRISPARNALRWLKTIINSYRDPENVNSQLIFMDGDGNYIAGGEIGDACSPEDGPLGENAYLSANTLADINDAVAPYVPELWEFKYPLKFSEYQTLKTNPNGIIQARFGREVEIRDFHIREIDYLPNRGICTYKLLPKRYFAVNECCFYDFNIISTGTNVFGSASLVNADLENLFVFINGRLAKFDDAVIANNEIISWDTTTGFGLFRTTVPVGREIRIIHIPPMAQHCDPCIRRFTGHATGNTVVLTGFENAAVQDIFMFYNGNLMKFNDVVSANNEIDNWDEPTLTMTMRTLPFFSFNVNRELRVFAFVNCDPMP